MLIHYIIALLFQMIQLGLSDAYLRYWTEAAFDTKPLLESLLTYCQLDTFINWEQTPLKLEFKMQNIYITKLHLKLFVKLWPFFLGLNMTVKKYIATNQRKHYWKGALESPQFYFRYSVFRQRDFGGCF